MAFFFSSRRRHTRLQGDWSSDVCSSDLFLSDGKDLAVGLLQSGFYGAQCRGTARANRRRKDRKSTRLNSSHLVISYAVFCLKKKKPASAPELHIANAAPPRRIASPDRVL